jgi:hypothetical protein
MWVCKQKLKSDLSSRTAVGKSMIGAAVHIFEGQWSVGYQPMPNICPSYVILKKYKLKSLRGEKNKKRIIFAHGGPKIDVQDRHSC